MNDFLEEWEWPDPNHRRYLVEPFESGPFEWRGESVMATICAVPERVFFRPHVPNAFNYAITVPSISSFVVNNSVNPEKLSHLLHQAIKGEGRLFHLAPDAQCSISQGRSYWINTKTGPTYFRLPFDPQNESSATVFEWIQQNWKNENSEMNFSWRWHQWSQEKRLALLMEKVAGLRELMEIMCLIALCQPEMNSGIHWSLGDKTTSASALDFSIFAGIELPANLQLWSELLKSHFNFEPLNADESLCLIEYAQRTLSNLTVWGENASAHEKIEAALQLREWLRNHAPDRLDLLP